MQEISNSLRERLAARPQPETHPDPDTLSAYVEQVLSPAERSRIIEHLADCRDCREIVALSLPQLEQQQPVLQVAPRSRWWTPAYRWATLAATIAVATTLVVERPWQKGTPAPSARTEQATTVGKTEPANLPPNQTTSSPAIKAPATSSGESTSGPRISAAPIPFVDKFAEPQSRAERRSRRPSEKMASPPPPPGIVGGVTGLSANDQAAPHRAVMESDLVADARAVPPRAQKVIDSESVNRDAAAQQAVTSREKGEVTAAAANVLPLAPQPQPDKQGRGDVRKFTPPLSATNTRNAMAPEVVPPNVSSSQPPPSADENTLSKMGLAKKVTSKVGEGVKGAVRTVMEAANPARPPSGAQGFAGVPMAAPPKKPSDSGGEFRRKSTPQLHWRITPDHKLVNFTDSGQMHEAYTQSPDIQFRVVVTRGDQVWAGGNNATLIHSWNGGVQWETLKVPDSGDITSITIDDGWQVKTSNGQTFVSTDHGQTWVPLQQPK